MKTKPKILVFSGYGLNCEEETKYAFDLSGGAADIVHINDLIAGEKKLKDYDILAFPGGFSYGDDIGSGKAYANKLRNHLMDDINKFVSEEKLVIGICNGFQVLVSLGLLRGALTYNDDGRYVDRWVDLKIEGNSPWFEGIKTISLPIAHGEGKFYMEEQVSVAARYVKGEICKYQDLPANPNGSLEDIAAVTSHNGRVLGMMPHPERAIFTTQSPMFPYIKELSKRNNELIPETTISLQIFKNAIGFFHDL